MNHNRRFNDKMWIEKLSTTGFAVLYLGVVALILITVQVMK